ncbi:ABC transporter permease [Qipengyuania sp. 483]
MNLVFAHLRQHKLRTVLLTLVAMIAFLIFGTLAGALKAVDPTGDVEDSDELMVHSKVGLLLGIPLHYGQQVGSLDSVAGWAPVLLLASYFGEPSNPITTTMTDVERYLAFHEGEIVVDAAARERLLAQRDGILIDRELSELYGWDVGDRFSLTSDLVRHKDGSGDWPVQVAGIYDVTGEDGGWGVIGHYDYVNSDVLAFEDKVHWLLIRTISPDRNDAVAAEIDQRFANSAAETKTEPGAAMAKAFLSQIGDLTFIVQAIVGAAFVTMLLVVGNSISLGVQQRTKEIGILRALGFSRRRVFAIVLSETVFLVAVAFALGMTLAAFLVARIFEAFAGGQMPLFYLPLETVLLGLAFAIGVALLTGGLPSYRAMQLQPTEAFRRA